MYFRDYPIWTSLLVNGFFLWLLSVTNGSDRLIIGGFYVVCIVANIMDRWEYRK